MVILYRGYANCCRTLSLTSSNFRSSICSHTRWNLTRVSLSRSLCTPAEEFADADTLVAGEEKERLDAIRAEKVAAQLKMEKRRQMMRQKFKERRLEGEIPKMNVLDAVKYLKASPKFEKSKGITMNIKLKADLRQPDQIFKSYLLLPHRHGGNYKTAVFADGKEAELALEAGAAKVGTEDLAEYFLEKGLDKHPYKRVLATPSCMRFAGSVARQLAPKGLLPNAAQGTMVTDVAKGVYDARFRWMPLRTKTHPTMEFQIGKVEMSQEELMDNILHVIDMIVEKRPKGIKKVKKLFVSASITVSGWGRSIKLETGNTPFLQPYQIAIDSDILTPKQVEQAEEQELARQRNGALFQEDGKIIIW